MHDVGHGARDLERHRAIAFETRETKLRVLERIIIGLFNAN